MLLSRYPKFVDIFKQSPDSRNLLIQPDILGKLVYYPRSSELSHFWSIYSTNPELLTDPNIVIELLQDTSPPHLIDADGNIVD